MKKLLALFAALVALCLISTVALAESAPVEEPVGEVEFELVPEDIEVEEPEVAVEELPVPADDSFEEDSVVYSPYNNAHQDHAGMPRYTREDLEAKVAANDPKIFKAVKGDGTCEGTMTIYYYPCEQKYTDKVTGKERAYYHMYTVYGQHRWASNENTTHPPLDPDKPLAWDDWGNVVTAPTCTQPGLAEDYCVVCGQKGEKTRVITALGHSWEREKEAYRAGKPGYEVDAANLVIDVLPDCVHKTHGGTGHFECIYCGEPLRIATDASISSILKNRGVDAKTVLDLNAEFP